MFNLLVKAGGWDESGTDSIDRERLFEYTEQDLMHRLQPQGAIDRNELQRLPTVLMPETWKHFGDNQLAQVVRLSALSIHHHEVRFSYVPDESIPKIPNGIIVEKLTTEWGLGRFETTRTHWAVKDAELYRTLIPILTDLVTGGARERDSDETMKVNLSHMTTTEDGNSVPTDADRRIATELPLEHLRDAESIEEHLARVDPSDPPQAISASKSLIEATIKHVLEDLKVQYNDRDDIPTLAKSVHKSLRLHPDYIAPTAKGRKTIQRILSNLSQVSVGVAELRNEYGMDHGRTRSSRGLGFRHAGLAFGAAQTYCRFLLETLADRQATMKMVSLDAQPSTDT